MQTDPLLEGRDADKTMRANPEKQSWISTALEIDEFHKSKRRENKKWTASDTAGYLLRSIGSVSQYLLIARWLKTHENQIRQIETMKEALVWIREKEEELELR